MQLDQRSVVAWPWNVMVGRLRAENRPRDGPASEDEEADHAGVDEEVDRRAGADADRDGEEPDQRSEQREPLRAEPNGPARRRRDSRGHQAGDEHQRNHAFSRGGLRMLIPVDEDAEVNQRGDAKNGGFRRDNRRTRLVMAISIARLQRAVDSLAYQLLNVFVNSHD